VGGDIDGVALLERALGYALGSVAAVTSEYLTWPTPCAGWNLWALLHHVDDSLAALEEGLGTGRIAAGPAANPTANPTVAVRTRAWRLLAGCAAGTVRRGLVAVAGEPLPVGLVAATGAVEVAVHGWDVARACGRRRPIPADLAADMLDLTPLVVTDATRYPQFGPAVRVPAPAGPSDRLVAFLGRDPAA
jgi:uncharacterized protein (TIGR03086 family)